MTDEPVGAMSHDEYEAALRKDLAEVGAKGNADTKELAAAHAEVARLSAAAKAASEPDAQIKAGWEALHKKIADLF